MELNIELTGDQEDQIVALSLATSYDNVAGSPGIKDTDLLEAMNRVFHFYTGDWLDERKKKKAKRKGR